MENYEVIEPVEYLEHHGTKGMRWGIRRYQNADGSLTAAGQRRRKTEQTDKRVAKIERDTADKIKKMKEKARYQKRIDKAKEKAEAQLAKAEAKYSSKKKQQADEETAAKKPKSLSEMSNDEIQEKINRIRLEQQLAALTPQQTSKAKAFIESAVNEVILPAAKNVGKQYLEKTLKDKLGLSEKENPLKELKAQAEAAGYKQTIANAKKAAADAKKAEQEAAEKEYKLSKTKKDDEQHRRDKEAEDERKRAERAEKAAKAEKEAAAAQKKAEQEAAEAKRKAEAEAKEQARKEREAQKIIDQQLADMKAREKYVADYQKRTAQYEDDVFRWLESQKK